MTRERQAARGRQHGRALAEAAFAGVKDEDIQAIFERTEILDGRHVIEPGPRVRVVRDRLTSRRTYDRTCSSATGC